MSSTHDAYAALRHRDYRCLLSAAVLGSIGLELQTAAVGWELYRRTESPRMLGLTGLAYFLPAGCFLLCIVLLAPIRPRQTARLSGARTLKDLLAGVRFVWKTELLLAAITLDLFAVLLGGATMLLPIYASDILAVSAINL